MYRSLRRRFAEGEMGELQVCSGFHAQYPGRCDPTRRAPPPIRTLRPYWLLSSLEAGCWKRGDDRTDDDAVVIWQFEFNTYLDIHLGTKCGSKHVEAFAIGVNCVTADGHGTLNGRLDEVNRVSHLSVVFFYVIQSTLVEGNRAAKGIVPAAHHRNCLPSRKTK